MPLQPKRLAEEGVPVAAILLFWYLLAVVPSIQNVGGPIRTGGVVMAALCVAVRGAALSSEVRPTATGDLRDVIVENARVAVSAAVWFLGAMFVYALDGFLFRYGPSPVSTTLGDALAGAGLGVVGLYAVAVGVATFDCGTRGDALAHRRDAADPDDETPADD